MSTTFPTGFSDLVTVAETTKTLADDGSNNGLASVSQILDVRLPSSSTTGNVPAFSSGTGALKTASPISVSGSNIGVGTTTPTAKLDIAGGNATPSLSSDVAIVEMTSSTSVQLTMSAYNGSAFPVWMQTKQSTNSGSTFPLHINPLGGNVSIGLGVTSSVTATLHVNGTVRTASYTVATLPVAATVGAGTVAYVTDALAPSFGSAVVGGGAVGTVVYSTGSAWNVG